MRRRTFEEISDDEWEPHRESFNPSRVLKRRPNNAIQPPLIESFTYVPKLAHEPAPVSAKSSQSVVCLDDDSDDFEDFKDFEEIAEPSTRSRRQLSRRGRRRKLVIKDDYDDFMVEPGEFEVEAEEELMGDKIDWSELEEEDDDDVDDLIEERKSEDLKEDVVGKALRKCAKISAELRQELYGSGVRDCYRYAETDASSCKIVTQEDVNVACAKEDSDFEPILKPYQLVGVNFLLLLHRKRIGGAILADEMGLGKTVQAVTYLTLLKHLYSVPGPHLIVCPASVLENWERELKKWCPTFSVLLFHGTGRTEYSKELSSMGKAGLPAPFDVLLVCYSLFERHSGQQKDDRKVLKRWKWNCVLLDEAHALKDKNSYRWKNLMSVAHDARQRLMLTGTPLQNDLHELWSLLEFMMPDIFATGDVDLKKLLNTGNSDLISHIKSILGPFILRRLKSDVMQQLVPKVQHVKCVPMVPEQSVAYEDAIEEYRSAYRARCEKSTKQMSNKIFGVLPKRQISNYFMQFRKIANHPLLVRRIYTDKDVARIAGMLYHKGVFGFECSLEKATQELKSYNDFSIHQLLVLYGNSETKEVLTNEHVMGSAKCQVLGELIPNLVRNGHRALIFSQWTSMLDILEWTLEVIGVTYRRLDGGTQVSDRQTIVDTFNNDKSIFACLLSTRAGGQGLNLIGADTVIIHDMDFNPQMDRQAEDRCHRIGQVKPVTIFRLVTEGTVDENIYEIARRKLTLDAAVLKSGAEMNDGNSITEQTMGEILSSLLLV